MSFLHIHHDTKIWGENAGVFDPKRFSAENMRNMHPSAYMAFSAGPRQCPGNKYAINVMKVVMSHIFRNFRVTTRMKFEDIEFKYAIVASSVHGYHVTLHQR